MDETSKLKTNKYKGGNAVIDRLIAEHWPDLKVWMVNGYNGRQPVVAQTAREAERIYKQQANKHAKRSGASGK